MLEKVRSFFLTQLRQGATPKGLALTCALGFGIAIFPLLGTTTFLCFLAGLLFRLNQPSLQAINYVLAPVQLLMIPVFLKLGAWICRVQAVSINPRTMVDEFFTDPGKFLTAYGWAGLQGVLAWAVVAPLVSFVVYHLALLIFRGFSKFREHV